MVLPACTNIETAVSLQTLINMVLPACTNIKPAVSLQTFISMVLPASGGGDLCQITGWQEDVLKILEF
eukprot:1149515-Pelagomonas_calceolata.AAC.2